ncbi:MAG TPA: HEAT repeat domain-containing protein [Candidatus Angelobacter sp.]
MKCEEISPLLPDYLQGGLPPEQNTLVKEHMVQCEACSQDVALWAKLGTLPAEQPSPALRARFDAMLASYEEGRWEKRHLASEHHKFQGLGAIFVWLRTPALSMAWAFVLLIGGFLAGRYVDRDQTNDKHMAQLHNELESMKRLVVISMLQQQSASERLQGVSISRQSGADPKVLDALLYTLRYDSSVDVRLAALDAVTRYGSRPEVRKGLIDALEGQQSPLVQVALIDALVDIHDSGAIQQLKKLQQDPKVDPSVRKRAEWGVVQLS